MTGPEAPGVLRGIYSQNAAAIYQSLAYYMRRSATGGESEGVVFILGAGCSMQYGLPGFERLLQDIARDHLPESSDGGSVRELRRSQEVFWSALTTKARQEILQAHLGGGQGRWCLGYLILAKLLHKGWVKAILDMNFDGLLEQACHEIGYQPRFSDGLATPTGGEVLKIHGGLAPEHGRPIISLKETEFFGKGRVARNLNRLLLENHIVMLGYEGEDPDLRHALWNRSHPLEDETGREDGSPVEASQDPKRIFVFQVEGINPQLFELIRRRNSDLLTLSGPEAGFENVMEALWRLCEGAAGDPLGTVDGAEGVVARDRRKVQRTVDRTLSQIRRGALGGPETELYVTNAERIALACCFGLAQEIRAGINVPEVSRVRIDEHAEEVYAHCNAIARAVGFFLTPPEKHLLFCTAILHDLGYFLGCAEGETQAVRGWWFLHTHGERTAEILDRALEEHPYLVRAIYPVSYHSDDWPRFWTVLLQLCHCHTWLPPSGQELEIGWSLGSEPFELRILGQRVAVRADALLALFVLAELLSGEQPVPDFSSYQFEQGPTPIEDPVMSLLLHHPAATFAIDGPVIRFQPEGGAGATKRKTLELQLDRVRYAADQVEVSCGGETPPGRRSLPLVSALGEVWDRSGASNHSAMPDALEEHLIERIDGLRQVEGALDPQARQRDLVAVFCLPGHRPVDDGVSPKGRLRSVESGSAIDALQEWSQRVRVDLRLEVEPRVPLHQVAHRIADAGPRPALRRSMLGLYFECRAARIGGRVAQDFVDYYEARLYPAWRFFASAWLSDVYHISMARSCLDFGSTDVRIEVGQGIQDLLKSRVFWKDEGRAQAHDGCTLCTGRLIQICCRLANIDPAGRLASERATGEHSVRRALRGLLEYLVQRDVGDPAWMGNELERFQSIEYLAVGVRSLASVLAQDASSGGAWLRNWGIDKDRIARCFREQWQKLSQLSADQLIKHSVEDSVVLCLSDVARTLSILLEYVDQELLTVDLDVVRHLATQLDEASVSLRGGTLGFVDNLHLPIQALLSNLAARGLLPRSAERLESLRRSMVRVCYDCANCGVWITRGEDTGSWGYNADNTLDLVQGLEEAWRHMLAHQQLFDPIFEAMSPSLAEGGSSG